MLKYKPVKLEIIWICRVADCIVPGAGAFEVAAHAALVKHKESVKGRARLGK